MSIDRFVYDHWTRIDKRNLRLFLLIFILGIVANLSLIIHSINNPDGILAGNYITGYAWDISLGRWGFVPFYMLNGGVVLPALTTIVSIFVFSVAIVLILQIIPMQSWFLKGITGGILIAFPSFTQHMTYFYIAEAYASSFLIAVLAAYILDKKIISKKVIRYVTVVILLTFSMSIFQSMIGVTVALWLCILLIDSLSHTIKDVMKKVVEFVLVGICSLGCYFISIRVVCALTGNVLSDYRGISESSSVGLLEMLSAIPNLYKTFFRFYFTDMYYPYTQWGMHVLFAILLIIFIIVEVVWCMRYVYHNKSFAGTMKVVMRIIFIAIIPLIFTAIGLLAVNTSIDFKMLPQMMVLIALVIYRLECIHLPKLHLTKQFIIAGIGCILIGGQVLICNAICEGMILKYNAAMSLSNRILTALDSYEGYNSTIPVAILGNPQDENWLYTNGAYLKKVNADTVAWGQFWSSEYNTTQRSWYQFFNLYHGVIVNMADDTKAQEIVNTQEFKDMDVFPESNSIQMINNVLTVKISDFK